MKVTSILLFHLRYACVMLRYVDKLSSVVLLRLLMKKIKKLNPTRPAYWFFCQQDNFWVLNNALIAKDTLNTLGLTFDEQSPKYLLGYHLNLPCILVDLDQQEIDLPQGEWRSLRDCMMQSDEVLSALFGRAWQVANFIRTHKFCGQCGNKMFPIAWEVATQCRNCGHRAYPRISPAVIMAIVKNGKILLGKNKRHKGDIYSVLAGFVEVGETLEQTVERETKEEAGITVKNIRYFGSQPWPFPHNIMVGYIADYNSGELNIDTNELIDANWYGADELPELPGEHTIARLLINEALSLT